MHHHFRFICEKKQVDNKIGRIEAHWNGDGLTKCKTINIKKK